MSFTNYEAKEINCKVLYFGPKVCGKTANLRSVYNRLAKEVRSGLLELADTPEGSRFFDFLPLSIGEVNGFHLKLHMFTMPANPIYRSVRSVILKGIDGFVFVADSRVERMADNIAALQGVRRLLTGEDLNMADMPRVFQYNFRDARDAVSLDIMHQELNPGAAPEFEAVAAQSVGTLESLQAITKAILNRLAG